MELTEGSSLYRALLRTDRSRRGGYLTRLHCDMPGVRRLQRRPEREFVDSHEGATANTAETGVLAVRPAAGGANCRGRDSHRELSVVSWLAASERNSWGSRDRGIAKTAETGVLSVLAVGPAVGRRNYRCLGVLQPTPAAVRRTFLPQPRVDAVSDRRPAARGA